MTDRRSLTIGMVGMRAYEMQAWHAPGASAVEEAVWSPPAPDPTVPRRSRLMRLLKAVTAAAVIAVKRK